MGPGWEGTQAVSEASNAKPSEALQFFQSEAGPRKSHLPWRGEGPRPASLDAESEQGRSSVSR